jgi:hypothetical protein
VVIGDFGALGAAVAPDKAEPPLVLDLDRALAARLTGERLEPGGERRSAKRVAASSMSSLPRATLLMAFNSGTGSPRNGASVRCL